MSVLKKLAGQTAVYGLSSVVGRVLNYLLVPLYTAVFSPAEYGIVTELYAYVAFLNVLYVYGLETAYFRFSKDGDDTFFFNLSFTSILVSSLMFSGILWVFSDSIAQWLHYPDKGRFIRWLAAILAIDALVAIPFARLRQQGKAMRFAVFKLSNIALNILLNLFFILLCPVLLEAFPTGFLRHVYDPALGVGYVFLSNLLANALYLVLFLPLWRKVRLTFTLKAWKRMMNYAWPILLIGFAGVTNEMFSRAILKHRLPEGFYEGFSNLEILGIFGACYKLAVFMTLAVQAFRYAFEPFFFAQSKDKNSPQVFSQVMTWFVVFGSFSWVVLSIFLPYYAPIFLRQQSYLAALNAVPWLLGAGLLLGVFYNLSLWYKLTDKTLYGAYISLIGAMATFVLNWVLIPIIGYMGSAIASFGAYFLMTFISYVWGQKHYPVPYELPKIVSYLLLACFCIAVNAYTPQSFLKSVLIVIIFLTLPLTLERRTLQRIKG